MQAKHSSQRHSFLPAFIIYLLSLAILTVIYCEAFVNLEEQINLSRLVTTLDTALIFSYTAHIIYQGYKLRRSLTIWLYQERLLLLLSSFSIFVWFFSPRTAAIGIFGRYIYLGVKLFLATKLGTYFRFKPILRPSQTLALSFLSLIAIGTLLLLFPASTIDGKGTSLVDAAFTMASATSGTGLIVQDTGSYFSTFGLVVLLLVVQIGSMGIMVLAASFAVMVGGRLPSKDRDGLEEAGLGDVIDVGTVDGLKHLIKAVIIVTVGIEFIGALALFTFWATGLMELREAYNTLPMALWWCVFHSVSAFCHAGFSLEPNSLMNWVNDPFVSGTVIMLITIGGIGFPVFADLASRRHYVRGHSFRKIWQKYHIQTRVVLIVTFLMNSFGMLYYLFYEYDASLRGLPISGKLIASLFQAVSLRSAGFNSIDFAEITLPTLILCVIYMFIGSSSGSTGGGVRLTTATVVFMAIKAMLRGREDIEIYGRTLPKSIVYRSISIVLIAGFLCTVFLVLICATQTHLSFDKLLFETISAFGTVGLSMGITGEFDETGKWLLTALMYFGRVGPLTLALAVGERISSKSYQYPEGRIAVG